MKDPTGQIWQSFSMACTTVVKRSNSIKQIKELVKGFVLTGKRSGWHLNFLFGRFIIVLGISLSFFILIAVIGNDFLSLFFISITLFLARKNGSGSSLEVRSVRVDQLVVLLSQVWHLTEDELSGKRPKEGLHRELAHVSELEAHSDIVVVLDSFNLTPEDKLLSLNSGLQGVQSHLDLHTLIKVEGGAVVAEVFDLLREVENVHFCL